MFEALALVQASAVRASMLDSLDDQRFCVLVPSVSRMITLSLSGAGSEPSVSGRFGVSECHPHSSPMVTLVLPDACMASILLLRLVHPVESRMSVSGIIAVSCAAHWAAGNSVCTLPATGVVSSTSFCWSRSITHPVQLFFWMLFTV